MRSLSTPKDVGESLARFEYFGPSNIGWAPSREQIIAGRDYYLGLTVGASGEPLEIHVVVEHERSTIESRKPHASNLSRGDSASKGAWTHHFTAYYCESGTIGGNPLDTIYEGSEIRSLYEHLPGSKVEWKPPFVSWWLASGRPLQL